MRDAVALPGDAYDDQAAGEIEESEIGAEDGLTPGDLAGIVLYTLDWSVQSLLERIGSTFDIAPSFQRRDAWTHERKSRYLESLILGLPVPQIVVAEDRNSKGHFIVLDGKQRLITMKQFAAPDDRYESFRLQEVDFLPELVGMTLEDVRNSLSHRGYAESFLAQPVRTIVVRDWGKDAVLYHIFVRLNQNSLSLSPQELRQALFPGAFASWVDKRSADSEEIRGARGLSKPDFRMRDAEMLLRAIALLERIEKYAGNLREFLDQMCEEGNRAWKARSSHYEDLANRCERGIRLTYQIFEGDAFRRFDGDRYVRQDGRGTNSLSAAYLTSGVVSSSSVSPISTSSSPPRSSLCCAFA